MAQRGAAIGRTQSVPAPIGGLNAVDSVAGMPPTDALVLDNFFPQPTFVQLRNGATAYTTGLPSWVESFIPYDDKSGVEHLFAVSGTAVYDCTSFGAVGGAVVTGLTNARWESTNIGTAGGQFLYACNGVDKPLYYDGATWVKVDGASSPAITGVTTTNLFCPKLWKNRLWFCEVGTARAWYLGTQSVGGAATALDVSTQFPRGGFLAAILTFSLSSATSFDDYIGFLSSEGDLAVYQGSDPASSTTFAIVGQYRLGKPVGRRCWFKYGADAIIICSDGLVSVARVISVGIQQAKDALSYKIQQLVNNDVAADSGNYGWMGVVYPFGNKIIVNVPEVTNSRYHQYVQSTISGAWCTYGLLNSPWNAACFVVSGDKLFYGGNGATYQADVGRSDNGSQIFGSMEPAFNYFGTDRNKRFTMLRPIMLTDGAITPALGISLDFQTVLPSTMPTFSSPGGAIWGTSKWGIGLWSSGLTVQKNWQTVYGIGFSAALYMQIATTGSQVQVLSFDWVMSDGGAL